MTKPVDGFLLLLFAKIVKRNDYFFVVSKYFVLQLFNLILTDIFARVPVVCILNELYTASIYFVNQCRYGTVGVPNIFRYEKNTFSFPLFFVDNLLQTKG